MYTVYFISTIANKVRFLEYLRRKCAKLDVEEDKRKRGSSKRKKRKPRISDAYQSALLARKKTSAIK